MSTIRVAFQGSTGAYSEQALKAVFGDVVAVPCTTFEDVFSALALGTAAYACIPIENSIAGRVADIHHLLPHHDIVIVAEHFEPIRHQLLGVSGATLADITEVHSHIHALGQCREFIAAHALRAVVHPDTAGAACDIAKEGVKYKAAIASVLAAERYGLSVLANDIEDAAHNTTRFLIIRLQLLDTHVASRYDALLAKEMGAPHITTLFFTLKSVPAALYKAIGGFATNGINLTKIESYMSGDRFSIAQFYVDVEGHPDTVGMQHALDELRHFASEVRILGTYPAHPFRSH